MANGKKGFTPGKDYLRDPRFYVSEFEGELAEAERDIKKIKEEKERKNPLSARNLGMLNTVLATVNAMGNYRDRKMMHEITKAGGFENQDKEGGWRFVDEKKLGSGKYLQKTKQFFTGGYIEDVNPTNTQTEEVSLDEVFTKEELDAGREINKKRKLDNQKSQVDEIESKVFKSEGDAKKTSDAINEIKTIESAKKMEEASNIFTTERIDPMGLSRSQSHWLINKGVNTGDDGYWLIDNKELWDSWQGVQ